jgi:hypothetical protein
MKSIRLNEWVITILNQTIRADAEFQINQRNAWQEFSKDAIIVDGIDLAAGFQHQRSMVIDELTIELDLVPDIPTFWEKVGNALLFRKPRVGSFYRLKKANEQNPENMHVRLIIKRNIDNRYQPEVIIDPKTSQKPEEIHVTGIAR